MNIGERLGPCSFLAVYQFILRLVLPRFMKKHWYLLAVGIFLLGALGSWPYAYYQLLRWVVCGVGAYSAYKAHESGRTGWAWIFGITAVLFNPIAPFHLARDTWQILDIVATLPFFVFPFGGEYPLISKENLIKIVRKLAIVLGVIFIAVVIAILVSAIEKPF